MSFILPDLPYAIDALAPHISAETLEFHYGKHHRGYVGKLNGLVPGTEFEGKTLEQIITSAPAGNVFNNAAQIWNHTFYWNGLSPKGGGDPSGPLADALVASFGSVAAFKEQFTTKATTNFGSGWTWLIHNPGGVLEIQNTANADNPLTAGLRPLLTCDVWEHAYYIDYRNARAQYVDAFWNLVNWDFVAANL